MNMATVTSGLELSRHMDRRREELCPLHRRRVTFTIGGTSGQAMHSMISRN